MYALPVILFSACKNVFVKGYYTTDSCHNLDPLHMICIYKLLDIQSILMYHSVVKVFLRLTFTVCNIIIQYKVSLQ